MASRREIAELLGQEADAGEGGGITRVSAIADAGPETLVFAVDARALEAALRSPAGAVLASAGLRQPATPDSPGHSDARVLWVPEARYAFALAAAYLSRDANSAGVHATALVAETASLGDGTSAGAGAVIEAGVRTGEGCRIGPRAVIHAGTTLGDRVVVQAGAVLGSTGFGYARDPASGRYLLFPQQGSLVIEDDVEIGANTTIDRGALGETRIGAGSKLDNLVHIGHNVRIGRDVIIAAQTGVSGSSVIEDGAIVAGQVGIAEHVTIGPGVILGAKCGVPTGKKIRGQGEVFWGIPARPIREYLKDLAKLRRG